MIKFIKSALFTFGASIDSRSFRSIPLLVVLILLFAPIIRAADPTIVIHWSTVTADGDPELLKDRYGNPLSIGSGGNGTGYVVTLG